MSFLIESASVLCWKQRPEQKGIKTHNVAHHPTEWRLETETRTEGD
jgi:hypothetical protein